MVIIQIFLQYLSLTRIDKNYFLFTIYNMQQLLENNINEFGNKLSEMTDDEQSKLLIKTKLNNLPYYEILIFILVLDINKIDFYIQDLITKFKIIDNEINREFIRNQIDNFIQIKNLFNQNE